MPGRDSDGDGGRRVRDYATLAQAEQIIASLNEERRAMTSHGRRVTIRHEVILVLLTIAVTLAGSSLFYSARILAAAVDRNYERILAAEAILKERAATLKLLQRGLWVEQGRREAIRTEIAGLRRELDAQDRANRRQNQTIGRRLAGRKRYR